MKFIYATTLALCSFAAQAVSIPNQVQITRIAFDGGKYHNSGLSDLQIDVNWLKEPDSNWGYYAQFFWQFQAEHGAYTGLQQDSYSKEKKKAIFSIWDKSSGHKVKMVSPWCRRFDWEGDGAQCIIQFNWKAGRIYSFRVQKESGGEGQRWASYVVDNVTDDKTLIGVLEVPNYLNYRGSGNISPYNLATTMEFYDGDRSAPCSGMPYFALEWNGPFANNSTASPFAASTDYTGGVNAGCPNVNNILAGPFATRQEVGPNVTHSNRNGENLFAPNNKAKIDKMDCLFNWVETAFPAATGQREVRRLSSIQNGTKYMRDYRRNGRGFQLGADINTDEVFFLDDAGGRYSLGDMKQYLPGVGCIAP